ncbi:MAG: orotidine-5'-phosphate decarboxylase [Thermodesulfobacteriota bacterium]|nr:orotidine-5'-phosphate decarboxylase [Thermodesulfobacteriota bacterium]
MSQKKPIDIDKRIIFALDVASPDEAKKWVERLEDQVKFYKVGLELFLAGWFPMIEWIIKRDLEVMVDLKFFDVPETVGRAVRQIRDCGATFATVHGNDGILKAAAQNKGNTQVLAVTVLTSLDQGDIRDLGFDCSVEQLVLSRAKRALAVGCDGVVSSGLEAPKLRAHLGDSFLVVVPGVRPVENRQDDQKRVVDVGTAFENGADHIVVGRPIRQAEDPVAVVKKMKTDIAKVLPTP